MSRRHQSTAGSHAPLPMIQSSPVRSAFCRRPGWLALLVPVMVGPACMGRQAVPEEAMSTTHAAGAIEPPGLATVASEPVRGRTVKGGQPFDVQLRTPALKQFPCTSCHEGRAVKAVRTEDFHQNIQPVHPAETGLVCTNCHVANDVSRLVLGSGETATLDQAYRLCTQCHFSQADAWAGGGHGKRVVAWQGRRVVMSCTGCHDPHQPAFGQRIPLRGPTIPGSGARQP